MVRETRLWEATFTVAPANSSNSKFDLTIQLEAKDFDAAVIKAPQAARKQMGGKHVFRSVVDKGVLYV